METKRIKDLCYADNALVFVHTPGDLTRLEIHISRYYKALNAKFNYGKMEPFSVFGRDT